MGQGPSSVEQWLKGLYILDLQDWAKVAQCHDHLFSMNKLQGPNQSIVIIGTVLVLVLKNEHFVKFFIPILSQVIGTIKYSKIPSFCCYSY